MALGKGLSALIPDKMKIETAKSHEQDQGEATSQQTLDVALIQDNRFQPRQNYDDEKLDELIVSIQQSGLLQPIVVRPVGDRFEVIAGERRLKAARKAGLLQIPVVVKSATDQEALVLALVENLQREELNPIEKAESYQRLIEEFRFTQEEIAKAVGKDRTTVTNLLRLLKLPMEMKQAVFEGHITEGHARCLLAVSDVQAQTKLFLEILQNKLSVREAEDRIKNLSTKKTSRKAQRRSLQDPEIVAMEQELQRALGTKVRIENRRGNKGKIIIEYYSLNDFDRILAVVKGQ